MINSKKNNRLSFPNYILSNLSRVTSTGRFIPEIDGLRFIAIAGVVLLHTNTYVWFYMHDQFSASPLNQVLRNLFMRGAMGVQLFFAISGFILMLPFIQAHADKRPQPSLKKYFLRRLTRLEPPYLINLCIISMMLLVTHKLPISKLLPHLAASMFYLHNIIYSKMSIINGVAWSLEVEVQFYILAPLIAKIFYIRKNHLRYSLIAGIAILFICLQCQIAKIPFYQGTLLGQIQYFLAGILLADIYVTSWKQKPAKNTLWDMISGICLISLAILPKEFSPLFPALIFTAYAGVFRGIVFGRIMRNKWLVTIGGMCYTIYLFHPFITATIGKITTRLFTSNSYMLCVLVQIIIICIPMLMVCSILFVLFEKPFMYRDWPYKVSGLMRKIGNRRA